MPQCLALSIKVSSVRPTPVLPFTLTSTGIVAACAVLMRSIGCLRPSRYLVREVFHHRKDRVGGRLPQPAYGCVHHRLGKFLEQGLVPLLFFDELQRLGRAHAAGRALAAGFLGEEFGQVARGGGGAGAVGKDPDRGRADKPAVLVEGVELRRGYG